MFTLPVQTKFSLAPLCIIIVSIILALTEPMSSDWLAYDRHQLIDFQWWRLITGHFLHTNSTHLLLNTAGLTLLWALHGQYYQTPRYLIIFFLLCLGKVLHEQIYGASEDVAQLIAANVAIDAHLFGTITGCIIILYYFIVDKQATASH